MTHATFTHPTHATRARAFLSPEFERQLVEQERIQSRIGEIGHEICEHIPYEDYILWVDGLTTDPNDDRATLAAHEAKLANLEAAIDCPRCGKPVYPRAVGGFGDIDPPEDVYECPCGWDGETVSGALPEADDELLRLGM